MSGKGFSYQEDIMIRCIGCLATVLLLSSPLRAGELDEEFGSKAVSREKSISPAFAPTAATSDLVSLNKTEVVKSSELDAEGPVQSFRHFGGFHHGFGGFGGFHRGFGYGGFGYGRGFGGYGYGRGFGYGGYGYGRGYGGFGYGLALGYGLGYGLGLGYGGLGYGGYGGYGGLGYGGYGGYAPVAYYSPYGSFGYRGGCW